MAMASIHSEKKSHIFGQNIGVIIKWNKEIKIMQELIKVLTKIKREEQKPQTFHLILTKLF